MKKKTLLIVALMVILGGVVHAQTILFVSPAGNNNNSGASWNSAKKTLAGALTAVNGITHIYMRVGNYTCSNVVIPYGVTVTGGYASSSTGTDTTHRLYPGTNSNWDNSSLCTILKGNNTSRVATVNAGGKLEGCVVTQGRVSGNGGGVLIDGGTVQHCAIIHNSALDNVDLKGKGGGAYIQNNGFLLNCVVAYNSANNGPGVAGTNGTLTNNTITANSAIVYPIVTTNDISNIASTSASCGGHVSYDGGAAVTARGVCWSTSHNPTINNSHTTNGIGVGSFTSNITELNPNTTYYVRAYATNSFGTAYGEEKTFTTDCNVVNITISGTTTISYGHSTTLTASGANSYVWKNDNNTIGNSANVTVSPTSTSTYTVTGTNTYGCTGVNNVIVTVTYTIPTVVTFNPTNITGSTATGEGAVTNSGGYSVTSRGVCWSTAQNPTKSDSHTTDGSGTGYFSSNITGLIPYTTYHVRAYATNAMGTAYGLDVSFTTAAIDGQSCPNAPTVTDYDGNSYNTVQIGSQCWMKQNLRTTHYADGTSIPFSTSISQTAAYRCNPNNSAGNVNTYGFLYNGVAAMKGTNTSNNNPSGIRGVCPTGWHMPSHAEWLQLTDYVSSVPAYLCGNATSNIAKALASTAGWTSSPNTCQVGNQTSSNNSTGFTAVPAGAYYGPSVGYDFFNQAGIYWSTTYNSPTSRFMIMIAYSLSSPYYYNMEIEAFQSVRCLRD